MKASLDANTASASFAVAAEIHRPLVIAAFMACFYCAKIKATILRDT
jgi:hypothetical protein